MTELYSVLYTSTLASDETALAVSAILASARVNNARHGITGLLVFDGQDFCQYLEGPHDEIGACMARILSDRRHTDAQIAYEGVVQTRRFGHFGMGYAETDIGEISATIRALEPELAMAQFMLMVPQLDVDTPFPTPPAPTGDGGRCQPN